MTPTLFHIQNKTTRLPAYLYGGKGALVVLLHGGPNLPGYMSTLATQLSPTFEVVEYYQRDSDLAICEGPFTLTAHADDLGAVVRHCAKPGKPVIVVGHSWGSVIALEYAKQNPAEVKQLALIGPAPLDPAADQAFVVTVVSRLKASGAEAMKRFSEARKKLQASRGTPTEGEALKHFNAQYWPQYFPAGQAPALEFADVRLTSIGLTSADYHLRIKENSLLPGLEKITIPVLHLHGSYDPVPADLMKAALETRLKHYTYEAIAGAGHFPWLERTLGPATLRLLFKHLA